MKESNNEETNICTVEHRHISVVSFVTYENQWKQRNLYLLLINY